MKKAIFLLLIIISIFFRLYNLAWGAPFYFHPDERNIANAVSQLQFPNQMNPHFFAYGSFPIYTTYLIGSIIERITMLSFTSSIFYLRLVSSVLSIGILGLLFLTGNLLGGKKVAYVSVVLAAFSTGLIQFAHFGTFEMYLSFLSLLLFFLCLKLHKTKNILFIGVSGIIFGLLMGTKLTSLYLLPLPLFCLWYQRRFSIQELLKFFIHSLLFFAISLLVFLLTNPFTVLDFYSFASSMNYESSVAFGTLYVFYTGEFFRTVPVLFQFTHVFPFLLNPIVEVLFVFSLFYFLKNLFSRKNEVKTNLLLLTFLIMFLPQAFLFAKWTRYMMPTLPFIHLMLALFLNRVNKKILLAVCIVFSIFWSFAYMTTTFLKEDVRISAAEWTRNNISKESKILSEVYDLGLLPFNNNFSNLTLFNFYDLDSFFPTNKNSDQNLESLIKTSDYILIPSQRILKSRTMHPEEFPNGNTFYRKLFAERLGYREIYESPCDIWCRIIYLGSPVFNVEETVNVFDRPSIFIFKKNDKKY